MSHRFHPDVHEHGLADDCDACEEIALAPMRNADEALLRRWVEQAVTVPRSFDGSDNELVAVKNVLDTLERFGRLAEAAPELAVGYLRDRWLIAV